MLGGCDAGGWEVGGLVVEVLPGFVCVSVWVESEVFSVVLLSSFPLVLPS